MATPHPAYREPPASVFPGVSRASYADQAYAYLFHRITSGAYGEGEPLPSENELASLLQISRPVVRKALERLRQDDLIESRRGSGSFVKPRRRTEVSDDLSGRLREVLMNLEFRNVVEPESAFFAAQRRSLDDLASIRDAVDEFEEFAVKGGKIGRHLDYKFHHAVATASGNSRFRDAIAAVEYDIDNGVNLVRYLSRYDHLERARMVGAEHRRIFQAIEDGDGERARRLMADHLEQARIRMVEFRPPAP